MNNGVLRVKRAIEFMKLRKEKTTDVMEIAYYRIAIECMQGQLETRDKTIYQLCFIGGEITALCCDKIADLAWNAKWWMKRFKRDCGSWYNAKYVEYLMDMDNKPSNASLVLWIAKKYLNDVLSSFSRLIA